MAPATHDVASPLLSGGGFRATLFHLGAIQRLFELGIATAPIFDTITSVSGGSITAAQWAIAEAQAATSENRPSTSPATSPARFKPSPPQETSAPEPW